MKHAAPLTTGLVAGIALGGAVAGAALFDRVSPGVAMPDLIAVTGATGPLWVQRHEVTVAEWNACHAAGGCTQHLTAPGGRRPDVTPATMLSHADAMEYAGWISGATGHPLRLPTAAEWRALAEGVLPPEPDPIFTDPALTWASAYLIEEEGPRTLRPTGAFSRSAAGIGDLDGPVWEWTQDCAIDAPAERCPAFIAAGLHMAVVPFLERDPARGGCAVGAPPAHLGMRLVSDAAP